MVGSTRRASPLRGIGAGGPGHLSAFSWAPPQDVVSAVAERRTRPVERFRGGSIRLSTPSAASDSRRSTTATSRFGQGGAELRRSRRAGRPSTPVYERSSPAGEETSDCVQRPGLLRRSRSHGRLPTIHRELRLRSRIHGGSLRGAWKSRVLQPLLPDAALRHRSNPPPALPAELRPDSRCARRRRGAGPPVSTGRPGVRRMQVSLLEFGHLQYRMESWASHGAALGLTYAFPLLDRRITEFALSLPRRMYFRDGWKRWLYRTAMDGILPDVVRWNPKKFDNAAAHQLRSVLLEPAAVYREPLLERPRQPARRRRRRSGRAGPPAATASSPDGPPSTSPSSPIGPAPWLAFTALQPA